MARNSRAVHAAFLLLACLLLTALPGAAGAADVSLVGVIGAGDKAAAVLAIDGGEPRTLKPGQRVGGVTLVAVEKDRALIEVDGRRRTVVLGQHVRSSAAPAARERVTLAADAAGHFFGEGAVNGIPVRFLVDTGATAIALPAEDAQRAGIDYRRGRRVGLQTANGETTAYVVRLDRVRLGGIELAGVEGVVTESGLRVPLLGMSFLNRLEMRREGDRMTLERRF